jgi:hypothetical protein
MLSIKKWARPKKMEVKEETKKQTPNIIKRLIIELKDDESMIIRGDGVYDSDKAIELLLAALNNIFGEPIVIITEEESKKIKSKMKMTDMKLKELSTLSNFINTLLLLKKIGILDNDVLQTLIEMRKSTTLLTPEEKEEMYTETAIIFEKLKKEEITKKLFSKYSSSEMSYG